MSSVDWDRFDLAPLADEIRGSRSGPDGERTIWALEQVLGTARIDERLLEYLLTATVCLLARIEGCSPRTVLEMFFRRSVPDETWNDRFRPLLG